MTPYRRHLTIGFLAIGLAAGALGAIAMFVMERLKP